MWRGIFARRDPTETIDKADRQRFYQNRRLVGGLSLRSDCSTIDGSALLVSGAGKWLRCRCEGASSTPVAPRIADLAREVVDANPDDLSISMLDDLRHDLSNAFLQAVADLRHEIGKTATHLLALGVDGPGLWSRDSSPRWLGGLTAGERLAEASGLTIIDDFPSRDQFAGGSGRPLSPLPLWFMLADRGERVSNTTRLVLSRDFGLRLTILPPSDGLDEQLPQIQTITVSDSDANDFDRDRMRKFFSTAHIQRAENVELVVADSAKTTEAWATAVWDIVRSVWHDAEDDQAAAVSEVNFCPPDELGFPVENFQASIAAVIGLMHLDQMPSAVPSITGASSPRMIGHLSPGSLSNWRSVLLNMSDYRPPAMKLRDAI